MDAYYVLNCLSLVVLLTSCFEKVHLARGIIEPVKNSCLISLSRIEQWILSLDVFNQQALVLDTIEYLKQLEVLRGNRQMNGSLSLVILFKSE